MAFYASFSFKLWLFSERIKKKTIGKEKSRENKILKVKTIKVKTKTKNKCPQNHGSFSVPQHHREDHVGLRTLRTLRLQVPCEDQTYQLGSLDPFIMMWDP